jgi:hypothetical protein
MTRNALSDTPDGCGVFRAAPKNRTSTGSEAHFMFKKEVNIRAKRSVAPSLKISHLF